MDNVVVTGISSGIGYGITKVLAAKGLHVFGSVRSESDKQRVCREFGDARLPKRTLDRMIAKQLGLSRQGK